MTTAHLAFSAARWTTIASITRAVLQLLQIAVLARFLSPEDFGLMAIVTVILSYALLFSDMGLSSAFVQRQQISQEERSSLYWLSVLIGFCLTLLVIAISPLIADFFNKDELVPLVMLVASNFFVISLAQQLRTDAEKALNFRPVALIEITSATIGFCVAVVVAWQGGGVYALVTAAMVTAWSTTILCWFFLAKGWRPLWRLRWREISWFARFGGGMVLNSVINQVNATVDLVIGGRILGASELGLYSIPRNLMLQIQGMVNPIFTRVGFPLIASIQHDNEKVKQVYLKTMNLTASVNAPIYVAIFVFAAEIVELMLGEGWHEVVPLMQVLAIWGLFRSFGNPVGSLLFGLGRVRVATVWNTSLVFIVLPTVWGGSQWGAVGMAYSMAALMIILFFPTWYFLVKPACGVGLWDYSRQVFAPLLCAGFAGLIASAATIAISVYWIRLGGGLIIGAIMYSLLTLIFNKEAVGTIVTMTRGTR